MKDQIDDLMLHITQVKMDFVEYIKDKKIPLEDRWNLFMEAPNILSESGAWIQHFHNIDDFDEDTYYEGKSRHETCHVVDVVEHAFYQLDDALAEEIRLLDLSDPDDLKEIEEKKQEYEARTKKTQTELKEHFLANNLKSFEFDW